MAGYATTFNQTGHSGRLTALAGAAQRASYAEEVAPDVAYIQGIETPIQETVETTDTGSVDFHWLMDDIDEDRTTQIAGENQGADWTTGYAATSGRVVGRNSTQIHTQQAAVADSEITQNEYGVPNEYDQAVWKKLQTLGLNIEQITLFTEWAQVVVGGAAGQTHGLYAWAADTGIPAGTATIAATQIPVPFKATVYAGAGTPLSKIELRDSIMQPAHSKGVEWHNMLTFVGPKVRNAFTAFSHLFNGSGPTQSASPVNQRNIPANLMTIIDNVDIFHGPWGIMYITNHRKLDNDTAFANFGADNISLVPSKSLLAYDPRYVRLRYKRRPTIYHLPKLNDGAAAKIKVEFGVEVRNPRALVMAYNIA